MEYSVIIETNKYTGNFSRQMCAYITGVTGDCGVGKKNINKDFDYSIFDTPDGDSIITGKTNEHGTERPVNIFFNSKTKRYTDLQIHFSEKPSGDVMNLIIERAVDFDENIKIKDVYAITTETVTKRCK